MDLKTDKDATKLHALGLLEHNGIELRMAFEERENKQKNDKF